MWFRWLFRRRRDRPPPAVMAMNRDELMSRGAVLVVTDEQARRLGWRE